MKTHFPPFLAALLILTPTTQATEISQALLTSDGEPLSDVTIRATQECPDLIILETNTNDLGEFTLDLPIGDWFIEADPADILNLGFFCAPTLSIINDGGIISSPTPGWSAFVAIPLQPTVTQLIRNGQVIVQLDFEWLDGLQPINLRSHRVERSTDLRNWEPIATVLLANPPIFVVDPAGQQTNGAVFYRTVETTPFSMIDLGGSISPESE